jgi:dihydroorotase
MSGFHTKDKKNMSMSGFHTKHKKYEHMSMSGFHTATNQAVSYIAVFTEHNHQSTAKNLVSLDDKEI